MKVITTGERYTGSAKENDRIIQRLTRFYKTFLFGVSSLSSLTREYTEKERFCFGSKGLTPIAPS
ncbi:hypothetical protein [Brevibacillus laterosporus]|uniref:hypothetical protein n=1 Tax=Brevibacillus laterosporus TaxID=1465 RepID=UPI003D1D9C8D